MDAKARLNYIKWDPKFLTEKPYHLYMDPPPGLPVSNYEIVPGPVETIHDLRKYMHGSSNSNSDDSNTRHHNSNNNPNPNLENNFPNLDDNGFILVHQPFSFPPAPLTEDFIQRTYLPSLEALIRTIPGIATTTTKPTPSESPPPSSSSSSSSNENKPDSDSDLKDQQQDQDQEIQIHWFDHRTRSSNPETRTSKLPIGSKFYLDDRTISLAPVKTVHVDQSPTSAISRIHTLLGPEKASRLLKTKRVRLLNIWRPYGESPVENHPLALCDGSSVAEGDLVAADAVRKSYVGEAYYLVAPPPDAGDADAGTGTGGYRWFYVSRQRREEVLVFKMFDSDSSVKAGCVPHVSFEDLNLGDGEGGGSGKPPRESIEARALVFSPL